MIGRFAHPGAYRDLFEWKDILRVFGGGLLALIGWLIDLGEPAPSALGTALVIASVAINGLPIVWEAIQGLMNREVNVDELVSLAIIASLVAGEFLGAAVVSFVMVLGALVEEAAGESARRTIRSLIALSPEEAIVAGDAGDERRPVEQVREGDRLRVRPGDRIPVDAEVTEGVSSVDESTITGEAIPVQKSAGDPVFAGTLNQNGLLTVKATRVGADSTLGRVIRLVTEAETHKPASVALIDRYAKWFTPAILLCAAIAWAATGELSRAVTVLIVGCPCALILAAPTATVAAIGRAARAGILVKGGPFLERAASADVVLFDKTGTLTTGDPRVDAVIPADGVAEDHVLRQAACVEQNTPHPLARAVLKAAHYAKITLTAAEDLLTEIGVGVRGCVEGCRIQVGGAGLDGAAVSPPLTQTLESIRERGATPLLVMENDQTIGVIGVSDPVRADAAETIGRLKALGVRRVGILSGDHDRSVRRVAEAVGATDAWSELKPEEKLNRLRELRDSGEVGTILFVGDGVNDAPALAAADVGVAMGARGTETALETADIALMRDDIATLPFLIRLGRRTLATIRWNIAFGLAFNLIAVIAGGTGIISPILGAVVHNVGSVIVVISSAGIAFAGDRAA
ncbi:MAG: heavy metal translocating P-type ATPase [Desulfococcaceae bacterium]